MDRQQADLYQLVALTWTSSMSLTGKFYPTVGIYVLELSTGNLYAAEHLPVTYRPGWLIQGRRSGIDSEVSNAQIKGSMVPKLIHDEFGTAMPIIPDTNNTGWHCLNGGISDVYTKIYGIYSAGAGSNLSGLDFHHNMGLNELYCPDGTVGQKWQDYDVDGNLCLHWAYEKAPWRRTLDITLTGNLLHYPKTGDGGAANLTQGSYVSKIYYNEGVPTVSNGNTTGLKLWCFSPVTSLASLSEGMIFESLEEGEESLSKDFIDLSFNTDNGNSEWETCQKAVDSYKVFETETLEIIRDTYHWKQLLPPLEAFKNWASPSSWAEVFLWFKYGILPTISDAKEIIKAFIACEKMSWVDVARKYARSATKYASTYPEGETLRGNTVTHLVNARVTARPDLQVENFLQALILYLQSVNIVPSARNIWQLVPYSFVVDWFINTKTLMKFADWQYQTCQYRLEQLILSHKRSVTVPATDYFPGASGLVEIVTYNRTLHSKFPPSTFSGGVLDPSTHWLEGVALIVSRKKRG
jgi:hypothetical protein